MQNTTSKPPRVSVMVFHPKLLNSGRVYVTRPEKCLFCGRGAFDVAAGRHQCGADGVGVCIHTDIQLISLQGCESAHASVRVCMCVALVT